ncbi:MAG TPA: hypothetical protein VM287_10635 [Egibacteraceae bacterium]|nr:hypothetical protein [Egibacteraceae bacterium]
MRPAHTAVTATLVLFLVSLGVLAAPARAQSDYAGVPAPAPPSGGEDGTDTYVGLAGLDPGVEAGYVGNYVGLGRPPANGTDVRTTVVPPAPPGAGTPAVEAAAPLEPEDLPPVVTGRDVVSLVTLSGGALAAFAVLLGRRRLH